MMVRFGVCDVSVGVLFGNSLQFDSSMYVRYKYTSFY
jgi:hypothetical protein